MSIPREDIVLILPIALALAGAVLGLIADAFHGRRLAVSIVILGLAAGGALGIWVAVNEDPRSVADILAAGGGTSAVGGAVMLIGAVAVFGGWTWFTRSSMGAGAAVLISIVCATSATLAASLDLLLVIICLEALALSGYALTAQARNGRSAEASVKYVIQGSVATGLLVLGFAILFGVYGSKTDLLEIGIAIGSGPVEPALAAMGLIVSAFAYKLGAFPFHSWAPDVFETAPPPSAGAMASIPKIAAVSAAVFVFGVAFGVGDTGSLSTLWLVLAAGSILFGNLVALKQTSYGRMLGYSGIAQVGYVLVGLAAPQATWTMSAMLVLVVAYGMAVACAFLGAEAVRQIRPEWDGSIDGMAGIGRSQPVLGVGIAIAMFSLTGMPLTAGFWGKFGVFGAALVDEWQWLVAIGVLGILASVVSFGYYGRVLRALYFDAEAEASTVREEPGSESSAEAEANPSLFDASTDGSSVPAQAATAIAALAIMALGLAPVFWGLEWLYELFYVFG
ncbi:MAG: NADH-quinone oxidoreductase subunit N [Coriobacteriia bacterium]|nr:NADH-quinone oxidoreductase subunit N [Coriobacteriia bacterium]